jgi:hypothetical protein
MSPFLGAGVADEIVRGPQRAEFTHFRLRVSSLTWKTRKVARARNIGKERGRRRLPRSAPTQRGAATKPSVLQRVGRMVWVSPRHAALALATGLLSGVLVSRIGGMTWSPYAAILGTLVGYPALVAVWRWLRPGGRSR